MYIYFCSPLSSLINLLAEISLQAEYVFTKRKNKKRRVRIYVGAGSFFDREMEKER